MITRGDAILERLEPECGWNWNAPLVETPVEQAPSELRTNPGQAIVNFLWAGWSSYQRSGQFQWPKSHLRRLGVNRALGQRSRQSVTDSELWSMALTDDLTGLLNRRGFHFLAYQQLKLAYRNQRNLLVFYCDLDNFKQINDRFGHEAGDEALIRTARVLEKTFRRSDVLSRFGGDEFVLLALETKKRDAARIERRLQKNLRAANAAELRYQLSLSIGVAWAESGRPNSLKELISRADQNLYIAKNQSGQPRAPAGGWDDAGVVEFDGSGNFVVGGRYPVRRQPGSERINEGGG